MKALQMLFACEKENMLTLTWRAKASELRRLKKLWMEYNELRSQLPQDAFRAKIFAEIQKIADLKQKYETAFLRSGEVKPTRLTSSMNLLKFTSFQHCLTSRYLTANFLDGDEQPAEEQPQRTPGQEPTTKVWALYYWYKREVGLHPELHSTGKKKKSLEALAQQHGISPQNLYQTFNAIGRNSEKNPKRNPVNIKMVIPLLADFPEAQQLAKNELERKK